MMPCCCDVFAAIVLMLLPPWLYVSSNVPQNHFWYGFCKQPHHSCHSIVVMLSLLPLFCWQGYCIVIVFLLLFRRHCHVLVLLLLPCCLLLYHCCYMSIVQLKRTISNSTSSNGWKSVSTWPMIEVKEDAELVATYYGNKGRRHHHGYHIILLQRLQFRWGPINQVRRRCID